MSSVSPENRQSDPCDLEINLLNLTFINQPPPTTPSSPSLSSTAVHENQTASRNAQSTSDCTVAHCSSRGPTARCLLPFRPDPLTCLVLANHPNPAAHPRCDLACTKQCSTAPYRLLGSDGSLYCSLCVLQRASCVSCFKLFGPLPRVVPDMPFQQFRRRCKKDFTIGCVAPGGLCSTAGAGLRAAPCGGGLKCVVTDFGDEDRVARCRKTRKVKKCTVTRCGANGPKHFAWCKGVTLRPHATHGQQGEMASLAPIASLRAMLSASRPGRDQELAMGRGIVRCASSGWKPVIRNLRFSGPSMGRGGRRENCRSRLAGQQYSVTVLHIVPHYSMRDRLGLERLCWCQHNLVPAPSLDAGTSSLESMGRGMTFFGDGMVPLSRESSLM